MGWGSGVALNSGVGCRQGLDAALLWLWLRPEATAPVRPLAWEPPGVALKKNNNKNKYKFPFFRFALFPIHHASFFFFGTVVVF